MLKNILMIVLLVVLTPFVAIAQEAGALDPVELIGKIVALIVDNLVASGFLATGVVGFIAMIATQVPNKSKNPWLNKLFNLINVVGQNTGKYTKNDPKL